MKRFSTLALLLLALLPLLAPSSARAQRGAGWLVTSRRVGGQADLWAVPATGGPWQQLTQTPEDERFPAWHPAGHTLAFAARRERNWDLYTLDLRTGAERRLTSDPHFDGWPAWSPDGTRVAFASSREGDLDLFVLDLASGQETNLTPDVPAHDWEPAWEDDAHLLFVSTRDDANVPSIFRLTLATGAVEDAFTSGGTGAGEPTPLPDGSFLVREGVERTSSWRWVRAGGTAAAPGHSWAGTVTALAAAPEGDAVAWLERRLAGDVLLVAPLDNAARAGAPEAMEPLNGPTLHLEGLAWGLPNPAWMAARLQPARGEPPLPPPATAASDLVYLEDLDTPQPRLSGRVLPAFQRTRARVLGEMGRDFLGAVSETVRPIDFASDESDYLSWHKAGRAVDTLLDLGWRGGFQLMEEVREDQHGDVYWRIWLRCPVQDGTCGEPLVRPPWDFSYEARWEIAPGEGGVPKPFQAGYYINFTQLAEDDGWERIGSYETAEFDWRQNNVASEYWHYQWTGGLSWRDAMLEVYTLDEFNELFNWSRLRARAIPLWTLRNKGLSLPADLRAAPAAIVAP